MRFGCSISPDKIFYNLPMEADNQGSGVMSGPAQIGEVFSKIRLERAKQIQVKLPR